MPGLTSLSSALINTINSNKVDVTLVELDERTDKPSGAPLSFQYFPETLSDTKAINYRQIEIPGGSLPIYQWINSGERQISFTAYFTSDMDTIGDPTLPARLLASGDTRRNVHIPSALVWLRRFMLPRYSGTGTNLTYAPRKCFLYIPNSGIGSTGGEVSTSSSSTSKVSDSMLSIMTQCDITYEAFFPTGLPRIVTVALSFAQIGQRNGDTQFPEATQKLDNIVLTGYTINPKKPPNIP